MAKIVVLANLNCDRVLQLDKALQMGGRFHYRDIGQRIGGGGANTGIGLVWANHRVALVSQLGKDNTGDWLLAQACTMGIDCHLISRIDGPSSEMLLLLSPNGERTIIRPQRTLFTLPTPPNWQHWDALYINSSAQDAELWAKQALAHCWVIAQLAKDNRSRPCHVLIASATDLQDRTSLSPWAFAKTIAGEALKYFIVTQGEQGAILYANQVQFKVPAIAAKLVDATGAGDVYAAGLIHGLVLGWDIKKSMQEAAQWGAIAVASASSIPNNTLRDYLTISEKTANNLEC